jgi:uncharacterized protein YjiS (DUF1127 family)
MKWVTRERPKIDRVACPWLVSRFIDRTAEFVFVPKDLVLATARQLGATPFDVPGAALSHGDGNCTFDAFLAKFGLSDPALQRIASIVRGADTGRIDLAPQAAGLLAISQGLSRNFRDDREMLGHGLVLYDALYSWARKVSPLPATASSAGLDGLPALICAWSERRRQRLQLREIDDRLLLDLGITRQEAADESRKPFWVD